MRRALHAGIVFRIATILALASCLTGCSIKQARLVREAQDAMSAAATAENELRVGLSSIGSSPYLFLEASGNYAEALRLTNQAVEDGETQLRNDQLLGTAYTVRAIAKWRLGDLDGARADAETIQKLADPGTDPVQVWPRDRALAVGLLPLMQVDELGRVAKSFSAATTAEDVATWLGRAQSTAEDLQGAANSAPAGHPLRLYFIQSELELAHVVLVGLTNLTASVRTPDHATAYHTLRDGALDREGVWNTEDAQRMKSYYKGLLGDFHP